ncbi:zinc-ribbon domain-containing protein [Loktanella salsilacus]|uniref:zinc-ribbon domain-containing protein n=1 Tax=Loktanella salsilacus TaxID=195913 RepID=UPI003736B10D
MRLICPNCGAQYEVGLDVIPDDGRDVQCSNCGQTWFEDPKAPSAAAEYDAPAPAQDRPAPVSVAAASLAAVVSQTQTPPRTAGTNPDEKPAPKAEPKPETKPAAPAAAPPPQPVRSQLDPSIADILREEAAREEAARKSEAAGALEQQADLGLTEPSRPRPAQPMPYDQSHVHKDNAQAAVPPKLAAATQGSRKELFPDIEEINSTLRSSAERGGLPLLPSEEDEIARRSSWRGFFVTLALIVILALIYGYADDISAQIPALEAALSSYVAAIDSARLWLDNQIASMLGDAATQA